MEKCASNGKALLMNIQLFIYSMSEYYESALIATELLRNAIHLCEFRVFRF